MSSSIPPQNEFSQGVADADNRYAKARTSTDELLPPVEPPSAGFIIQLFVIPAVIVAAVVAVWFVIESLARRGEQDPAVIVKALRSNNQARFQQAKELADMLRQPLRYPELKVSHELSHQIAAYVDELVEAGRPEDGEVTMRYFLVRTLGEFHVADGLSALINAAQNDPDRDVRREALAAIAVLTGAMNGLKPPQPIASDELIEALVALADDQDELVRNQTAFALGVVARSPDADPRVEEALERLADDPYTDARFNATIALAMAGSPLAPAALAENLDPEAIEASVSGEKLMTPEMTQEALAAAKAFKRKMLVSNGLIAANRLVEATAIPAESFPPLAATLRKLGEALPKMSLGATAAAQLKAVGELSQETRRTLQRIETRSTGP